MMVRRLMFFILMLLSFSGASAQTTVILVRHAEKADAPAADPPLTDIGKARADKLAQYLKDAGVSAIYSTDYARTRDTAAPVAKLIGATVTLTPYGGNAAQYTQALAARIRQEQAGKTVLVVGHSNTTPELVKALGAAAVPAIPETDYDNLFVVLISADGKASVVRAKY